MKLINCTPHTINIVGEAKRTIVPSGIIARVATTTTVNGHIDGIPLHTTTFGKVENLPPMENNTLFIVSALVKTASKRGDLVSPSALVRDDKGNVIGCSGLVG